MKENQLRRVKVTVEKKLEDVVILLKANLSCIRVTIILLLLVLFSFSDSI